VLLRGEASHCQAFHLIPYFVPACSLPLFIHGVGTQKPWRAGQRGQEYPEQTMVAQGGGRALCACMLWFVGAGSNC